MKCTSSSLQRVESISLKVDGGVSEIKRMIRDHGRPVIRDPQALVISVIEDDRVFAITLSATFMKNAEVGRGWSAIGLDEWIAAGTWWLLKVSFIVGKYDR